MTEQVSLSGDIDLPVRDEVHALVDAAARAAAGDGRRLVIDLGAVTFMDSTGLTCIAHAVRVIGPEGQVVLTRTPASVRRTLDIAGLAYLCDDTT